MLATVSLVLLVGAFAAMAGLSGYVAYRLLHGAP